MTCRIELSPADTSPALLLLLLPQPSALLTFFPDKLPCSLLAASVSCLPSVCRDWAFNIGNETLRDYIRLVKIGKTNAKGL